MLLVLSWEALLVRYSYGGNWTALFWTGNTLPIPAELRPGTYVFPHLGYDAQTYRYVAHDPLFRKGYSAGIDSPSLRYRRILVPIAAFFLAGGRQNLIDGAYIAIVLMAIFPGVYWSSVYARLSGRHSAWGLIFLLTPGALTSIDRMVIDGMMTALFAGFLVYAKREDATKLYVVLALSVLMRETGLLLVAGAAGAAFLQKRFVRALLFGTAVVPALGWYVFVRLHTSAVAVPPIFATPGWGLIRRLFTVREVPGRLWHTVVPVLDVLRLLGLIVSFALAVRWISKSPREPVAITIGLFVVLGLVASSPEHLVKAYGYSRPLSPLLLFVMLQAVAEGFWLALAPPLLVSLSIATFFIDPA